MKRTILPALAMLFITGVRAQEPVKDTGRVSEINLPQIVVLAEDLERDDQAQEISGLLQSSQDVFVSTAGYVFGQTRFRIRGLTSDYSAVMINGVPLNDKETGGAYWSSWGGLNDATRNKEILSGLGPSQAGFGGAGGITNIDTRASSFNKQTKLTYSSTNRSYRNRLMFLYATGMQENGWALTLSGSRRWAQEGYVEGTFYDAWSYFMSVEKKFNSRHSLNLTAYGAPNKRGRNGVSVQEAYDLAGTNYYNAYWGWQNGEKRNSRVNNYHQPMIILTHYFTIDEKSKLQTSAYYSFGRGGSSALDWYDVPDPRPDYYRKLPSYDGVVNGLTPEERENLWRNDPAFRQLDWDYFYFYNRKNLFTIENVDGVEGKTVTGNLSSYIVEERRNDRRHGGLNMNYKRELNDRTLFTAGLDVSRYKTHQYKTVLDLLGGDFYLNIDKYAERDFLDPVAAQNDLNHPNQVIREGDVFGYDYTGNINDYSLFVQTEVTLPKWEYYLSASIAYNEFWRTGHMRNGKFPDNSYGDSPKNSFFNYGAKGGLTYKITGRHIVSANLLYQTRAPFFRSAYISARTRAQTVSKLDNEKIASADISYNLRSPYFKVRISGYYTLFFDQIYSRSFYHESLRSFVNYQMVGVDKVHLGAELGLDAKVSPSFNLYAVAATGQYYYNSRPQATLSVDNSATVLENRTVYLENYRVGGFPQTALSGGIKYRSSNYIFAGVGFNYYDDIWLDLNPDRRTAEAVANYGPEHPERETILGQEKLDPGFTVDAYVGKSWRIDYKYFISVNLSVNNLLNNQEFAFGGFEQYRYDPFVMDKFPPKYFYMYGRQYFLNINFRF
ncbi:MAG: TonB-dependent receptor [Bacteroidales bacterium]